MGGRASVEQFKETRDRISERRVVPPIQLIRSIRDHPVIHERTGQPERPFDRLVRRYQV
jgi:hypothetical protein